MPVIIDLDEAAEAAALAASAASFASSLAHAARSVAEQVQWQLELCDLLDSRDAVNDTLIRCCGKAPTKHGKQVNLKGMRSHLEREIERVRSHLPSPRGKVMPAMFAKRYCKRPPPSDSESDSDSGSGSDSDSGSASASALASARRPAKRARVRVRVKSVLEQLRAWGGEAGKTYSGTFKRAGGCAVPCRLLCMATGELLMSYHCDMEDAQILDTEGLTVRRHRSNGCMYVRTHAGETACFLRQ